MDDSTSPVLLVTDAQCLTGLLLKEIISTFKFPMESAVVLTNFSSSSELKLKTSTVDRIISLAETPGLHSPEVLSEFSRVLKPGGAILIQEPTRRREAIEIEISNLGPLISGLRDSPAFKKALLYAGFSDLEAVSGVSGTGLAGSWSGLTPAAIGSTHGPLLQPLAFSAQKPKWEVGKSFSLKKKADSATVTNGKRVTLALDADVDADVAAPLNPTRPSWMSASDADDIIDEDSLLTESDYAPKKIADDCSDVKSVKKACKNCSCGRAEMESSTVVKKLTLDQIDNPQSSCGSCALGDAFRCAGCPYKGLPAFKLGEKVSLPVDFLKADV